MQPTDRVERVDIAQSRSAGAGPFLANGAALLLRATAIALLAAPLLVGIMLLVG